MAAQITNASGISEPDSFLAAISIPRSGSINDFRIVYNKTVLGAVTVTDLGVGVWTLDFVNDLPLENQMLITTGVESPQASGRVDSFIQVNRATANQLSVVVGDWIAAAANNNVAEDADLNAWIKIQKL